jgi:hypothetical protein
MSETGPGPNGEDFYTDGRMGGVKRYYFGPKPKDFHMRVSSELKNSVCFLCGKEDDGSYNVRGTGFFVSVPDELEPKDVWYIYLVTAKHIVDQAKADGYPNFHLRINRRDGGVDFVEEPDIWKYPKVPGPDVAVMPIYKLDLKLAVAMMPIQMALADEASLDSRGVGIGDEVLMVGLFRKRYGYRKNIPIVRGGIIAAMPEEPLEDEETGNLYDAYLIEIRSLSGLSGSPVIVFKDEPKFIANLEFPITSKNGYLLGLVRSHWSASEVEGAESAKEDEEPLNTGIATVTPIKEVMSIINGEELTKDRQRLHRLRARKNRPIFD